MNYTNAHTMVADLCSSMANAIYDEMAMDNGWYKLHKNRREFVREHLALNGMLYAQEARKILASMLNDKNTSDKDKEKIYVALVQDNALRGNQDRKINTPILTA